MRAIKLNDEVLIAQGPIVEIERADICALKEQSLRNERQRIRVCAHLGVEDRLHEMFIVHKKDTYIRPHKHLHKSESIHIIEGSADVVMFDDAGGILEVVRMSDYTSGCKFYYRLAEPYYHTLLIASELLVFHEITNGPFRRSDTIFAPWAPEESDAAGRAEFMRRLAHSVEKSAA
jgi:cupin fold WbuC family metalloprotein